MHPRWKLLTAAAAVSLASLPSPARADADPCANDAAPAKCYLAAASAIKDAKPGEAAALYLKSYRLDPKIDPLAGYGFSLALDNQPVAAAEVLEKAVEEYDKVRAQLEQSNSDANTLFQVIHRIEFVKEEINKLVPKIGKVQLKVTDKKLPDGITVMRKGGSDLRGSDSTVLWVTANTDVLTFTYPSGRTFDLEVAVPAGTISTVDVPADPGPPKAPPPPPPPPVDQVAPLKKKAYIFGGAGAALAVGGLVYVVAADAPSAAITGSLLGVGLVGIAAGGYFWYLAGQKEKAKSSTATVLAPVVTDQTVGLVLSGTL